MDKGQSLEWVRTKPLDTAIWSVVHELKTFPETIRSAARVVSLYIRQKECRAMLQTIEQQCDRLFHHLDALFDLGYRLSKSHTPPTSTDTGGNHEIQQSEGGRNYHQPTDTALLNIIDAVQGSATIIRTTAEQFNTLCYSYIPTNVQETFRIIERNTEHFITNVNYLCKDILLIRIQQENVT